jgi:hypothetical protein
LHFVLALLNAWLLPNYYWAEGRVRRLPIWKKWLGSNLIDSLSRNHFRLRPTLPCHEFWIIGHPSTLTANSDTASQWPLYLQYCYYALPLRSLWHLVLLGRWFCGMVLVRVIIRLMFEVFESWRFCDTGDSHLSPGMQEFASKIRDIHPGIFIHSVFIDEDLDKDRQAGFVRLPISQRTT